MSKSSKSVSFDEYRENSWEDGLLQRNNFQIEEGNGKNYNGSMHCRRSKSDGGSDTFYGIPHLPPPLEPRERLVPCIDPVTAEFSVIPNWWRCSVLGGGREGSFSTPSMSKRGNIHGRIHNSYIMPSSLAPVSQASNSRPSTFIPPPTAYRDEITTSKVNNPYHQCFSYYDEDDDGHSVNESNSGCDIIEIKRPGTVCLQRHESDYGLAYQYAPVSHFVPEVNSSISLQTHNDNRFRQDSFHCQGQQTHLRSGIFNLPEVYSPPPLEPVSNQVQTSDPLQLQGLMPSFLENNGISDQMKKPHVFPIKSPRMAYSEPILKSELEGKQYLQKTLSPRMRNKTFVVSNSNDCGPKRNCISVGNSIRQKLPASCNDRRLFNQNQDLQVDNVKGTSFSDGEDNCRPQHNGSGDNNDNGLVTKQAKMFGHHNCLSPRARISRLQPSVITPAITESLLCECLSNLKSPHWEDNFEAFSQIYNLTELHPGRVKGILNRVIWHGLPHLSSPRTKLARMACICFKRLFQTQKRSMETEGEKIFYRLLDLCGGLANNFIQQESREALVAAVEHMDPLKSLSFLELHGAKHKNPHVREFSAYLLSAIMDELPQNKLMNKEFSPRIVPMIVSFLREGLLQTRLHAKLAMDKIFDHPTFESKLRRYVSPENVRHIADTLREFRERRSGHI